MSRPVERPVVTPHVTSLAHTDLGTTASLHVTLLPHGLFPRLGRRYVRRWHRTFVDSPHGEALCVRSQDGAVMGFLLGTTDDGRYTSDVLAHHRIALAGRGALALAVRPRLARTFLQTRLRRYLRRLVRVATPSPRTSTGEAPVAVVHALITDPAHRGQGVGRMLLERFEEAVAQQGTPLIQLVTHAHDGAMDFYRRLGWIETDRRGNKDGAPVIQMDKDVAGRHGP